MTSGGWIPTPTHDVRTLSHVTFLHPRDVRTPTHGVRAPTHDVPAHSHVIPAKAGIWAGGMGGRDDVDSGGGTTEAAGE